MSVVPDDSALKRYHEALVALRHALSIVPDEDVERNAIEQWVQTTKHCLNKFEDTWMCIPENRLQYPGPLDPAVRDELSVLVKWESRLKSDDFVRQKGKETESVQCARCTEKSLKCFRRWKRACTACIDAEEDCTLAELSGYEINSTSTRVLRTRKKLPNQASLEKQGSSKASTKRAADTRKRVKHESDDALHPPQRRREEEPPTLRRKLRLPAPPLMAQQRPDMSHLTVEERLSQLENSMWSVMQQIQMIQTGQALIQQNILHIYDVIDENLAVTEALEKALYTNSEWYNPQGD